MSFFLRVNALGKFPKMDIDEDMFFKLKHSRAALNAALRLEEIYEMLITNYLELEKDILLAPLFDTVRILENYFDYHKIMLSLNVKLMNLLMIARLYLDSLFPHVHSCLCRTDDTDADETTIKEKINNIRRTEYDAKKEYRFMEELRNYTQHQGVPIHEITPGGQRTGENNESLEFSIAFFCLKKSLPKDNKKFKQKVLDEMDDKVDLKFAARSYTESLSSIHQDIRKAIRTEVDFARTTFETSIDEYSKLYPNARSAPLEVFHSEGDLHIESFPIMLEWDDVRIKLEKHNQQLINLTQRYVSGKI